MVRQLEATQGGLPLEFYFFLKNKEWVHYEHCLATIMEHVYVLAASMGCASTSSGEGMRGAPNCALPTKRRWNRTTIPAFFYTFARQ